MVTARRWYILLVSVISMQAVVWAVISLLGDLLTRGSRISTGSLAFQVAVILVGLPVFLFHWLWGQRLAHQDPDERGSALRRLRNYLMLGSLLAPFVAAAYSMVFTALRLAFGDRFESYDEPATETLVRSATAMVVLGAAWLYFYRIAASDTREAPESGDSGVVRRLYIFIFGAVGVSVSGQGLIELLRWILYQFGESKQIIGGSGLPALAGIIASLVVGLPLWVIFWLMAQRLFDAPDEEERESALRKFYLYAIVFVAALVAVTNATLVLDGILRSSLGLPTSGDIRDALAVIVVMAGLWAYHIFTLRGDAARVEEAPRQATVRRIYLYLVTGVGLAAFLIGLGSNLHVLLSFVFGGSFGESERGEFALATAAIIAGLPIWLLSWRSVQNAALAVTPEGTLERRALTRKVYLYLYLFAATMTVLGAGVYIVYRVINAALGARDAGNVLLDISSAVAFGLIAVGVWLYHSYVLRGDGQVSQKERAAQKVDLRFAIVDAGDGSFGRAVLDSLRGKMPELALDPIGLTPEASAAMGASSEDILSRLAQATHIIGPWTIVVAGGEQGAVTVKISKAVSDSPARKLLVPTPIEGYDWVGVDRWGSAALARQAVQAVRQAAGGEVIRAVHPMGAGATVGAIIGAIVLLFLLLTLLGPMVGRLFF